MRKTWQIALKDLKLIARNPMALLFFLLAPFLLTLGMAAITGAFSGEDAGPSNIPIAIVNSDQAQLGNGLVELFQSEGLKDLVSPVLVDSYEIARQSVRDGENVAALYIPEGFTNSIIIPNGELSAKAPIQLEFSADETSGYSVSILRDIIKTFLEEVNLNQATYQTAVKMLLSEELIAPNEVPAFIQSLEHELGNEALANRGYEIVSNINENSNNSVSYMAIIAPGMALMFLMWNVGSGSLSFLTERRQYTLQRNLISPTPAHQIIIGKTLGIFLRGFAQVLILVLASKLLFNLNWGNWTGILVLIASVTYAACGWGMLLTSIFKTPRQVSSASTSIGLIFGQLGGGFLPMSTLPKWLQTFGLISPNGWGSRGFTILASGGNLADLTKIIFALLVMGTILLGIASFRFRKNVLQDGG